MKRTLSSREKEVMIVIFDSKEELALHDIVTKVNERFDHTWKPQTVSTFLFRCVEKGFLDTRKEGRFTYYKPTLGKDDMLYEELSGIAQCYFNGNIELVAKKINKLFGQAEQK